MTITEKINNKNWSLSPTGGIVIGIDDVKQCISTILNTQKGSLPLQPNYGCGIYNFIDGPVNVIRPKITYEIIQALRLYEPRVTVTKILSQIVYDGGQSGLNFDIYCTLQNGDQFIANYTTVTTEVTPTVKKLTLQAPFSHLPGGRYFISLTLNGLDYPSPAQGFASISDLWQWVQNNWVSLGAWTFYADRIVLNVIANSGSLKINGLSGVQVLIPELGEGEFYVLNFNGQNSPDDFLYSLEDIMAFVLNNWGGGGIWSTDGQYLIYTPTNDQVATLSIYAATSGGFSNSFDNGFN